MSHLAKQTTSIRRPRRRPLALAALAGAVLTLAFGGQASAAYQDLRSPDARDAARLSELATATSSYQDLRSPDAADAGRAAEQGQYQDLRSPDARDAGRVVPQVPAASSSPSSSDGFDWGYLAIGGGALLLVAGAALLATRSLRTHAEPSVPTS